MNDHPIWPIARLAVMMAALLGVLYLNSSKFDATEIKSLCEYFLIAVGVEGGVRGIRGVLKKD